MPYTIHTHNTETAEQKGVIRSIEYPWQQKAPDQAPTILALRVHGPAPQKGEGHRRHRKLPPDSVDIDDSEGLRKTNRQPSVMVARGTFSSVTGRQVSVMDVAPPTSACGCHGVPRNIQLCHWKAGFRNGRSTTDQCLRLSWWPEEHSALSLEGRFP